MAIRERKLDLKSAFSQIASEVLCQCWYHSYLRKKNQLFKCVCKHEPAGCILLPRNKPGTSQQQDAFYHHVYLKSRYSSSGFITATSVWNCYYMKLPCMVLVLMIYHLIYYLCTVPVCFGFKPGSDRRLLLSAVWSDWGQPLKAHKQMLWELFMWN